MLINIYSVQGLPVQIFDVVFPFDESTSTIVAFSYRKVLSGSFQITFPQILTLHSL